ncbi:hypothetical protein CJI50_05610 [Bifidobacteriaceae bacterium NR021]|nr:hypothetical protein CJI50_05610 [Bifidobacteriaceae bacterium NR021]
MMFLKSLNADMKLWGNKIKPFNDSSLLLIKIAPTFLFVYLVVSYIIFLVEAVLYGERKILWMRKACTY